jgi:hypothetical protein
MSILLLQKKKILEKTSINDQFSSFYSEETQTRDHFSEKFFIGFGEKDSTKWPFGKMYIRRNVLSAKFTATI